MAKPLLVLAKTGWLKLDSIIEKTQNRINDITPLASETIEINELPDGMQICAKVQSAPSEGDSSTGGGGGTPVSIYGARNGAPYVFHLLQTSPPTPVP